MRIESSYIDDPRAVFLKGNLHTHTTRSDGAEPPQQVIDRYARLGYFFLALSDHDQLASLTGLESHGMILIPGNEVTAGGPHILHAGARTRVAPSPNRQQVLDGIAQDGGLAVLCHPNWENHFNHHPLVDMLALRYYSGIEIFNGIGVDHAGSAHALDKWDRLLSSGKKTWGFANDDTHHPTHVGRGWNVVQVTERSATGIIEALRQGRFYASTGVAFSKISMEGSHVILEAPEAEAIAAVGKWGSRLFFQAGPTLRLDLSQFSSPYVRFEAYGFADTAAWTQPFFLKEGEADRLTRLLQEKPMLNVPVADGAAELTGGLTDKRWEKSARAAGFTVMGNGNPPPVKTTIRCFRNRDTLFLGAECEEPAPQGLILARNAQGHPGLWTEDSLEFFIAPEGVSGGYYHVMVSVSGAAFASHSTKRPVPFPIKAASRRTAVGWSVELALPLFPLFSKALQPGDRVPFNVCRNRPQSRDHYVWSFVEPDNHQPHQFGFLEF